MACYQLPPGKLKNIEERKIQIKNLASNYAGKCYIPTLGDLNNLFYYDFQWDLISKIESSNGVRNYLLVLSKIGEVIQEDIDNFNQWKIKQHSFKAKIGSSL